MVNRSGTPGVLYEWMVRSRPVRRRSERQRPGRDASRRRVVFPTDGGAPPTCGFSASNRPCPSVAPLSTDTLSSPSNEPDPATSTPTRWTSRRRYATVPTARFVNNRETPGNPTFKRRCTVRVKTITKGEKSGPFRSAFGRPGDPAWRRRRGGPAGAASARRSRVELGQPRTPS